MNEPVDGMSLRRRGELITAVPPPSAVGSVTALNRMMSLLMLLLLLPRRLVVDVHPPRTLHGQRQPPRRRRALPRGSKLRGDGRTPLGGSRASEREMMAAACGDYRDVLGCGRHGAVSCAVTSQTT